VIKDLLVQQLTSPVRWEQDVRWLLENVKGSFVELAPGKVLGGLMRRIDRGTKVQNHAEPGD
jgi:[acyl-carrier-protein] S-malonyltransferase